MHLFGDPSFPRQNLSIGAIFLTLLGFECGSIIERLIWSSGTWVDYLFLALFLLVLLGAIKTFRLGLAAVPPDPRTIRLKKRGLN
jgi:hypothetical protein